MQDNSPNQSAPHRSNQCSLEIHASRIDPTRNSVPLDSLEGGCNYHLVGESGSTFDSIWLNFIDFNMTTTAGGDRLDIYDDDELLISLTNETFVQKNRGVKFNGDSDYIVSRKSLGSIPRTFMVGIVVGETIFTNVENSFGLSVLILSRRTAPLQQTVMAMEMRKK